MRALRVLREARVIAAEDTRRTAKLLAHAGIETPMVSLHAHNEAARLPAMLERLACRRGRRPRHRRRHSPAVRPRRPIDSRRPGRRHRRRTRPGGQRGARGADDERRPFEPVHVFRVSTSKTGSAPALVRGSGVLPPSRRLFRGAAPDPPDPGDAQGRRRGAAGRVAVCREITKRHEELIRAPLADVVVPPVDRRSGGRIHVHPGGRRSQKMARFPREEADLVSEFDRITENGTFERRAAMSEVARRFHVRTRDVFDALERRKSSVVQP